MPFALCSFWTCLWLRWHEKHLNCWVCFRVAGNTYASEGMTQLPFSFHTALHTPTALGLNSIAEFSVSGCSTFSWCPFTMSKMNPHELMSAILFQRTQHLYLCSNGFILQSTSLLSSEHLPGSSGRFNRTNANGAHDQLLSTQAKTNRNHLILSLAIINDFPYKQNKHKTFS